MPCAQKIGGVAYLRVDGVQLLLRGNLHVFPDMYTRAGVAGQDGVQGYTETPTMPHITGTLTDTGGLSLLQLANITCSTVTVELANGKVYVLRDAWVSAARDLNTVNGEVAVTFEGKEMEEMLSAAPAPTPVSFGLAA